MKALDPNNESRSLRVNAAGELIVAGGTGGGSSGGATEATAAAQLAELVGLGAKLPATDGNRVPVLAREPLDTVAVDESVAGTVYVYKRRAIGTGPAWRMTRSVTTGGITLTAYAGPANNPAATDPWASRTSLTYGSPQEA